jgi:hypothetical protein
MMNCLWSRPLRLRGAFLGILLFNGFTLVEAAPITFNYTGTVVSTSTPDLDFAGLIPNGTSFSLSYTFDSVAPVPVTGPTSATYQGLISNSTVTLGSFTFMQPGSVPFASLNTEISVVLSGFIGGEPNSQAYLAQGPITGALSSNWEVSDWRFGLGFPSPQFSSLDLPLVQPNVANARPDIASARLRFINPANPMQVGDAQIQLAPVPLPAAALLFPTGLSLLAVTFRRLKPARV